MSNNCDDIFKQIQDLQQQNKELADRVAERERALRAAGQYTASDIGNRVVLPAKDGTLREIDPADVTRGYQEIAGRMDSDEVKAIVDRGIDELARPVGAEQKFQNYDRILRETDADTVIGYARLAEALGLDLDRVAPDDMAFITQVYGKEELAQILGRAYAEFGVTVDSAMARASTDAAGFNGLVEKMARVRLFADRTKHQYLAAVERMADLMEAVPGSRVPEDLKRQAFSGYKLALVGERHFAFARRRTAQALRSLQDDMGDATLPDFIDDAAEDLPERFIDTPEFREAIALTPDDVSVDEQIGAVMRAVDDGPAGQLTLRKVIAATKLDGVDPKKKLDDPDWLNIHLKLGNAFVKDSQLASLNTQIRMNLGSNALMALYGPVETMFKNRYLAYPLGTKGIRSWLPGSGALRNTIETVQVHAMAFGWAQDMTRAALKYDADRAFNEGIAPFATNPDLFGRRMHTNAQDWAEMMEIQDMPYPSKLGFVSPENVAVWGRKMQVAARLLFDKVSPVKLPHKASLRALGTVDNSAGKFHYLFHLKADLEMQARTKAVQLGLFDARNRAEWVQEQIDEAIYQATPTEANIKAYRAKHNLKGSEITDDEIAELIAENNMAGAPTLSTQASRDAMAYSDRMRLQNTPGATPGSNQGTSFVTKVDRLMMDFRKDWRADTLLPYWRSPINAQLFDHRISTFALADTIKMLTRSNNSPEFVARTKAAWTMSAATLAAFSALEATGQIDGGLTSDPRKRNRIMELPYLGGLPVLNTLFLWKDLKTVAENSAASQFDSEEVMAGLMQVMTAQIVRSTGMSTIQQLVTALLDGNKSSVEKLMRTVGFIGAGQLPFIGMVRQVERGLGLDASATYADGPDTPRQNWLLEGADDPIAGVLEKLQGLAYNTLPFTAQTLGGEARKVADWLGSSIGHVNGIDLAKTFPFFPGVWPDDPIYPELDSLDQLNPPLPLLKRQLDGIGMSSGLQREFNDIYGTIKGNSLLGRNALSGRTVQVVFPIPIDTVTPDGVRITSKDRATIDLAPFLEKHVKGKTVAEAFRSLFTDPIYQAMEEDPQQSSNPKILDQPPAERRKRPAQLMVSGIKLYYEDLTRDELERRAASGASLEAAAWSKAKTAMTNEMRKRSLADLNPERPKSWLQQLQRN